MLDDIYTYHHNIYKFMIKLAIREAITLTIKLTRIDSLLRNKNLFEVLEFWELLDSFVILTLDEPPTFILLIISIVRININFYFL